MRIADGGVAPEPQAMQRVLRAMCGCRELRALTLMSSGPSLGITWACFLSASANILLKRIRM